MAPQLSRNRRRQAEPEPQAPSMFDMLNQDPDAQQRPPEPEQPRQAPTVEDLMRQMQEMQRTFEQRIEQAERANMALTQTVPVPQTPPQEPKFSLENLPDPVTQPQDYARELAQRTAAYNREVVAYQQAQSAPPTGQGNPEVLWEDFAEQYEDYANNTDQVAFATQQAVKEAQRRGIDVNRYMYGNTDRFFRDIVKHYEKTFGKPGEDEGEPEPAPRKRGRPAQDDTEANRTAGIFGGIDQTQRRVPAAQPQTDMLDDIRAWQRKSGYHA